MPEVRSVGRLCAGLLLGLSTLVSAQSAPTPADQFLTELRALCGRSFAGEVLVDQPTSTDNPFADQSLVMHVRDCSDAAISIPFHVGDDRSRTWTLTRRGAALALQHVHRHADGSEDVLSPYGGESRAAGSATRQEFPVDAASVALFQRHDRAASVHNTWALELHPGQQFVYELARPDGRLFRVGFDLTREVATPPPAWGSAASP